MRKNTLAKPFTIAGFVLGEVYMLLTVLAPNLKGTVVPLEAKFDRVLVGGVFFGPFGAAVGLGVWLLGLAAVQTFRGSPILPEDDLGVPPPPHGADKEDPGTR